MREIAALFPEGTSITSATGAYLMLIRLEVPFDVTLRGRPFRLSAGIYAYAGSANGPGGIAARVARHMRKDKKLHWHVDRLTIAARDITALAFPGGSECALVARLLASGMADIPVAGFGSSDCRSCKAHLLRLNKAGDSPHAAG